MTPTRRNGILALLTGMFATWVPKTWAQTKNDTKPFTIGGTVPMYELGLYPEQKVVLLLLKANHYERIELTGQEIYDALKPEVKIPN